jgi:predicted permease
MELLNEVLRRLLVLFRREEFHRDLEEEMRTHIEMQAEQNREAGMDPEEAIYAARREFGNPTFLKERSGETWGWGWLERFLRDLRYALRTLARARTFTLVAVISLALGIGANVAIFSLFNALMLRSLPVSHPEQLASIYRTGGWGSGISSYPLYLAVRERKDLFEGVLARSGVMRVRLGKDSAEFVNREFVSGDYFQTLGVRPALGRLFTPENDRARGAHPFAVLAYDFWLARFGADPSVVGRTIHVDEQLLTVIGVAQPRFRGVEPELHADVWVPATMHPWDIMNPSMNWVWILARPRPGVGDRQLQAALDVFMTQYLRAAYGNKPNNPAGAMDQKLEVRPGAIGVSLIRDQFQKPLEVLLAVVALVLLVACANVAGLMLARAAARRREIALRFSLGASRGRVLQQLMIESALIAGAGGVAGLAFARWGGRYLLLFLPGAQTLDLDVSPDFRVIGFAAALALLSVVVFGLVPAFRATSVGPMPFLKEGAPGLRGPMRVTLRKAFVIAQVALSVVIVAAAGLFAHSLASLRAVDPGFRNLNVLTLDIDFPRAYKDREADALRRRFLARVSTLPGVLATSFGFPGPYRDGFWNTNFRVPGSEATAAGPRPVELQSTAPRYFETIGSQPLRGREFDDRDSATAPRVAMVNEAFARAYLGGADPLDRVLSLDYVYAKAGEPTHIVGVVRDMTHRDLRKAPVPTVYLPPPQIEGPPGPSLLIRADLAPRSLVPMLRRELAALDPSIAITEVRSIEQQIDDSIYLDRLLATVSGFFATLSLLLAGVGLYGVMAYAVAQRTGEIGIRVALGAQQRHVLWMVLREGLVLVAAGIAVGVPISLVSARLATSLLFGIRARDPITLAATVAVLVATGCAAVLVPARRAARVDPMEALRYE